MAKIIRHQGIPAQDIEAVAVHHIRPGAFIAGKQRQSIADLQAVTDRHKARVRFQGRFKAYIPFLAGIKAVKRVPAHIDWRMIIQSQKTHEPAAVVVMPVGQHRHINSRKVYPQAAGVGDKAI